MALLAKAKRMLALLRSNSITSFTTDHGKLLYLTLISKIVYLGYASEVWASSAIGSITKRVFNAG